MQRSSRRKLSDADEREKYAQPSQSSKGNRIPRLLYEWKAVIVTFIVALCILIIFNNLELKSAYNASRVNELDMNYSNCTFKSLTYALYGKNVESGYLRHVRAVFERLGYQRVDINDNWDVLWAHEYPFRAIYSSLKKLKSHQRVNHFPGSGYITNKLELSTSELVHLPRAFRIPQDTEKLLQYARSNKNLTFVQKDNNHRGITIKHLNELELNANGTFVQEFLTRPFLIDGYKFDMGLYTILTSINPLRVYVYYGDVLFRFCPVKYHPFDPKDLDKYVVGDDYLPIWKVPSLKTLYTENGFSMKDTFDTYIRSHGKDPDVMWNQVNEAIRSIYLQKEPKLLKSASYYASSSNFFEMVRIDFVVDEDLNVYLMEANMSPNLSSAHYPPNQLLYEQVLYNTLALVGVAQRLKPHSLHASSSAEEDMMASLKNIVVFPQICISAQCEFCGTAICDLCKQCLSKRSINILKVTYKEHVNRLDCRRVYPPSLNLPLPNASSYMEERSYENQLTGKWFLGKCMIDQNWCT